MSEKKAKGGIIRLLKFDKDETMDPKTLFKGAKFTMRESVRRKSSLSNK